MEYSVQRIGGSRVEISFKIEKDEWNDCISKAYEMNKHKYKIEGFRSGKVPFKLLVNRYGIEIFYEEALDYAVNKFYSEILDKEKDLEVISKPDIDIKTVGEEGMSAVITTEIYPEVKLGDYKGLKIKKVNSEIHEAEVEAEISKVVESHARWIDIADREIKVNDKITLDYSGSVDGIQFEGGTAEKATLDIGSGQFIPGFEDQLVGAKIGEERNVEVTFPVDYHSKDLAGKKAVFKCTVHEIKEKQLPELNDDFAKDLGDYDTLEEYKKSVRESLEQKAIDKAKYEEENLLIEKIAINSTRDIPDVLIEQEIQRMINDFSIRMAYSGLKFEDYLKYTGSDMDKFKNEHREEARESVKARLILEAIIKSENLTVEKEEVDKEVELLAKSSGKNLDDFKNEMKEDQIARIMNKIIGDKLFDFLRNNNTFE